LRRTLCGGGRSFDSSNGISHNLGFHCFDGFGFRRLIEVGGFIRTMIFGGLGSGSGWRRAGFATT
jgi:hypothetical protein